MGPAGSESKDDYAGEDHQQITALLEALPLAWYVSFEDEEL
jgi:hypothetical protein